MLPGEVLEHFVLEVEPAHVSSSCKCVLDVIVYDFHLELPDFTLLAPPNDHDEVSEKIQTSFAN